MTNTEKAIEWVKESYKHADRYTYCGRVRSYAHPVRARIVFWGGVALAFGFLWLVGNL